MPRASTAAEKCRQLAATKAAALGFAGWVALLIGARADSWRTAGLAGLAAAAVVGTRIRFAPHAAVALLVAVAIIALVGRAPGRDQRPASAPARASTPDTANATAQPSADATSASPRR